MAIPDVDRIGAALDQLEPSEGRPAVLLLGQVLAERAEGTDALSSSVEEMLRRRPMSVLLLTRPTERGAEEQRHYSWINAVLSMPLRSTTLLSGVRMALGMTDPHVHAPRDSQQTSGSKGLVLLAEDNAVNSMLALRLLKSLGWSVELVRNGREAVDAVSTAQYDLVLMDCQMPEMDGFEATQKIRARESHGRRIPIVALTANAMDSDRQRCLDAGMDDFLTKPISPEALRASVERWTIGRGAARWAS